MWTLARAFLRARPVTATNSWQAFSSNSTLPEFHATWKSESGILVSTANNLPIYYWRRDVPSDHHIFGFDGWRFDSQLRTLSKGSRSHRLTTQQFDLLLYLLENPCRPIHTTELRAAVWPTQPNTTEAAIKTAFTGLYRLLNDRDRKRPVYILRDSKNCTTFLKEPRELSRPSEPADPAPADADFDTTSETPAPSRIPAGEKLEKLWPSAAQLHGAKPSLTSRRPTKIRKWILAAVGGMCLLFGTAAVIRVTYLRFAWPALPANTLVVGLAVFSPDTPMSRELRNRIQLALEWRESGGPALQVRLLDGELNGADPDFPEQAKALSHNRVNIVLAATSVDGVSFLPTTVVVRQFGAFVPDTALAWGELKLKLKSTDRDYGDSASPISDLIKILYAFHYGALHQIANMEKVLNDLHDRTIASNFLAELLWEISRDVDHDQALILLNRARTTIDPILKDKDNTACREISDDNFKLCLAVATRSEINLELAQITAPQVPSQAFDFILKDNYLAESFFERTRNPEIIALLRYERAQLFSLVGNVRRSSADNGDPKSAYLESKNEFEELLEQESRYGRMGASRARNLGALAHVLLELARLDVPPDQPLLKAANEREKQAFRGCNEDKPPSEVAGSLAELVRRLSGFSHEAGCLLSDDQWAEMKYLEGGIFEFMAQSSPTLSTIKEYRSHAIDADRNALKVMSDHRLAAQWAGCNYNMSNSLINASLQESPKARRLHLLMAINAARASLAVFTKERFRQSWCASRFTIALSLLRLSYIADDVEEKMRLLREVQGELSDIRLQVGSQVFLQEVGKTPQDLVAVALGR
jgi:hypothetical protein